jgi:hypothetical protein
LRFPRFGEFQIGRVVGRCLCRFRIERRFLGELRSFFRFSKSQLARVVGRRSCRLSIGRRFLGEFGPFVRFGKFQLARVVGRRSCRLRIGRRLLGEFHPFVRFGLLLGRGIVRRFCGCLALHDVAINRNAFGGDAENHGNDDKGAYDLALRCGEKSGAFFSVREAGQYEIPLKLICTAGRLNCVAIRAQPRRFRILGMNVFCLSVLESGLAGRGPNRGDRLYLPAFEARWRSCHVRFFGKKPHVSGNTFPAVTKGGTSAFSRQTIL